MALAYVALLAGLILAHPSSRFVFRHIFTLQRNLGNPGSDEFVGFSLSTAREVRPGCL